MMVDDYRGLGNNGGFDVEVFLTLTFCDNGGFDVEVFLALKFF